MRPKREAGHIHQCSKEVSKASSFISRPRRGTDGVVRVIRSRAITWVGHVARVRHKKCTQNIQNVGRKARREEITRKKLA
jgi:hypothetical protein